jgi:N-acetyl-anhydromuramyl-L-alanine amidase AmpD
MDERQPPPSRVDKVIAPMVAVIPCHAANYSALKRVQTHGVVMHATCGSEGAHSAKNAAAGFAQPVQPPRSAHYFVDSESIVLSVPPMYTAWHAGHMANSRFIGIELCGRADQTADQWHDKASAATLVLAAQLVAALLREFRVPAVILDPVGLRLALRGIATHAAVSAAWRETNHTDPGPGFPLRDFRAAVAASMLVDSALGTLV